MPRKGRLLEQTVASIEEALGKVLQVKSPEICVDKDTGQHREVDVTIRGVLGSTPIFIMVECRDRDEVEDVRWIEEIQGKKQTIGPDKTIAVSSDSFTQPAILKAKAWGIELRLVQELTPSEVRSWFKDVTIQTEHNKSHLQRFKILFDDPSIGDHHPRLAFLGKGDPHLLRFTDSRSGEERTILQMWKLISLTHNVWKNVPEDGQHVQLTAPAFFPEKPLRYSVRSQNGESLPIVGITFEGEFWKEKVSTPFLECVTYTEPLAADSREIASALRTKIDIEGRPFRVVIVMDKEGRAHGLTLWPEDLPTDAQCPCLGGKRYGDCHGLK